VIRTLLDANDQGDKFEQAIFLLSEAQSALRVAIEESGLLRQGSEPHLFLVEGDGVQPAHLRLAVHAAGRPRRPQALAGSGRAHRETRRVDSAGIDSGNATGKARSIAIRYHLKAISSNSSADHSHDWQKVVSCG